ncbi:MAG: LptF/LptG family permease [Pontiellaceae bacterium]|nr:LptF/LptG family permease [Pontiellaceae bacterium]MBN2783492.1 LptF/LptG family permease [Pontiellaceae bacterium]
MKILVRYLFINLLMPLLYLLLAFTMLFVIADLMDNAEKFLDAGTPALTVLQYYGLKLPSMVIFIVPICLLLSTLYSLSMLTRHSEIVAMRASGISIYRIVRPYMLMGFICFLFTAVVNEYFGPKYAYRADQLLKQQEKASEDVYFENIPYENPLLGHSWYIESFDTRPPKYVMHGITLRQQRPDGSDELKITAAKGQWLDHQWWFEDGAIQYYDEQSNIKGMAQPFEIKEMHALKETPFDFLGEAIPPDFKSSLDLYRYMADFKQFLSATTLTKYRVNFHHKLTMPFVCIIATIIGIPVGAHTGRKGALAGIMFAIGMFFGFYTLQFLMEYLAKRQFISFWTAPWSDIGTFDTAEIGTYIWVGPWSDVAQVIGSFNIAAWSGAWTAVIAFAALGSYLIHRMR